MTREELLTTSHMVKLGLVLQKSGGASGADSWQGMPFWYYKDCSGFTIVFRGTFSRLCLEGFVNSRITTVGDLVDVIRILSGCPPIDIEKLEI